MKWLFVPPAVLALIVIVWLGTGVRPPALPIPVHPAPTATSTGIPARPL